MPKRRLAALLLVGASILAGPAVRALPFTGTLVVQFESFDSLSIPGSGSGDPTRPSISADAFVGGISAPVVASPPITQLFVRVDGNAAGTVGTGPSFQGIIALRGFGIGATIAGAVLQSRVGFPGAVSMNHCAASATLSVLFDAWTSGIATIARTHTGGSAACTTGGFTFSCPSAMLGGATANALFFGGAAQVVLVAPIDIWSSLAGALPTFTVLGLNYVPEPSELLLLASGALTMVFLGRRRRSTRS